MLLEFRARNYRSFRDETALSLVASSDHSLEQSNTFETGVKGISRAVRSAAILGPNAGGKTTLLRGLQLMRGLVVESAAIKPGQSFNVQPFLLSASTQREPTLFEVTIVLDGVRYQYGFELTPARIVSEWLLVYQKAKPQRWIERRIDPKTNKDVFEFSPHLQGHKSLWSEATRENALFLSTAVQLNSESLRPLFDWFAHKLFVHLNGADLPHDFSTNIVSSEGPRSPIANFLRAADIGIEQIVVVKGKQRQVQINLDPDAVETQHADQDVLLPRFRHRYNDVVADFDYGDESQGTQKLYSLAGPVVDVMRRGATMVLDELDRSLHPLLVQQFLRTFHDSQVNALGAQLVFSTHDATLLNPDLLRRDQIWLVEKDETQSSRLSSLADFSPRKNEAFEHRYLGGRYGGIPTLEPRLLKQHKHAKG